MNNKESARQQRSRRRENMMGVIQSMESGHSVGDNRRQNTEREIINQSDMSLSFDDMYEMGTGIGADINLGKPHLRSNANTVHDNERERLAANPGCCGRENIAAMWPPIVDSARRYPDGVDHLSSRSSDFGDARLTTEHMNQPWNPAGEPMPAGSALSSRSNDLGDSRLTVNDMDWTEHLAASWEMQQSSRERMHNRSNAREYFCGRRQYNPDIPACQVGENGRRNGAACNPCKSMVQVYHTGLTPVESTDPPCYYGRRHDPYIDVASYMRYYEENAHDPFYYHNHY